MAETTTEREPMVQMYDISDVKRYFKIVPGLFWSSRRLVKAVTIKQERTLFIDTQHVPDKIILNGKLVTLTESHD